MVNLNTTQNTLLNNVEREKQLFDSEWAAEVARHKAREEELKRPVRQAIVLADQTQVPQLRIAKAAGFNQVNQLRNWLRDKTTGNFLTSELPSLSQQPSEGAQSAVDAPAGAVFLELEPGIWRASLDGQDVRFTLYNYDGSTKVVVTDEEEVPAWFEAQVQAWGFRQGWPQILLGWPDED